jgi:hypothetical protein
LIKWKRKDVKAVKVAGIPKCVKVGRGYPVKNILPIV